MRFLTGLLTAGAILWTVAAGAQDLAGQPEGWFSMEQSELPAVALAGEAQSAGTATAARFTVLCLPDGALEARLDIPEALGFDSDPFEGPEGAGLERPLLSLVLGKGRPAAYHVNGWWSDATLFTFAFAPSALEVARWLSRPGQTLHLEVRPPETGPSLQAVFSLPRETAPLDLAVKPCLRAN